MFQAKIFLAVMMIMQIVFLQTSLAYDTDDNTNPIRLHFKYINEGKLFNVLAEEFKKENDVYDIETTPLFGIHEVDLNSDGLFEYIVRLTSNLYQCNKVGCHHGIVSINEDYEVRRLAYFKYAELDVSDETTSGVKNILVYDNAMNDFSPSLYKWNSSESVYTKEEKG